MGWIFVIVMGIVIGLLGKFVAPGDRDNIPIWLTVLCGIAGVLIGYGWLGGTEGIDWLAFVVSIVFAAILVMIAATLTGRRPTGRRSGKVA
ncbi:MULTISPECIES: GlsB/YeaQ/YmgE family stress response membrane protein [unclassified Nocardioides]|uniref:GlsB/YeaQ/YmgE family stress response membrane protein n=1 Tax=unclassified Nocardioides TaxID=2615069 RepID=UPI0036089EC1